MCESSKKTKAKHRMPGTADLVLSGIAML